MGARGAPIDQTLRFVVGLGVRRRVGLSTTNARPDDERPSQRRTPEQTTNARSDDVGGVWGGSAPPGKHTKYSEATLTPFRDDGDGDGDDGDDVIRFGNHT